MKRSEMVNIIEEYFYHTEHLDIPCSLGSDFKVAAEELVVLIEQAGMLPPPTQLDPVTSYLVYCYYPKVKGCMDSNGFERLDTSNSQLWEPEDE